MHAATWPCAADSVSVCQLWHGVLEYQATESLTRCQGKSWFEANSTNVPPPCCTALPTRASQKSLATLLSTPSTRTAGTVARHSHLSAPTDALTESYAAAARCSGAWGKARGSKNQLRG